MVHMSDNVNTGAAQPMSSNVKIAALVIVLALALLVVFKYLDSKPAHQGSITIPLSVSTPAGTADANTIVV